jgi:hypothetical protein
MEVGAISKNFADYLKGFNAFKHLKYMGFEIFTAVPMKNAVFLNVAQYAS